MCWFYPINNSPRLTNYALSIKLREYGLMNLSQTLTVFLLVFANDSVFIVVREYCLPFILREQLKASIREQHIKHLKQRNYDSTIENKNDFSYRERGVMGTERGETLNWRQQQESSNWYQTRQSRYIKSECT